MIMWIVLGYLAASMIASLVFYAACVAAAHADHVREQQRLGKNTSLLVESEKKQTETLSGSRLVLRT